MDVKRINDFVRNLDSAINITGITVYGVDDEGHSVKIDTEMLANPKPTFTEASTRTNLVGSGESTTTLWGKVKKWFSDLKTVATTGVFSDLIDKNVSTGTVAFTEASSRTNIATGESESTLWGKVKKFFSDLKTVAFSGSYNDLTDKLQNATTLAAGLMSAADKTKVDTIGIVYRGQLQHNLSVMTSGLNLIHVHCQDFGNDNCCLDCYVAAKGTTGSSSTFTWHYAYTIYDRTKLEIVCNYNGVINVINNTGRADSTFILFIDKLI